MLGTLRKVALHGPWSMGTCRISDNPIAPRSYHYWLAREELGISVSTVRHWRKREDVYDRPHTRKNLLATLSPAQEAFVVELRRTLRLPLDDLLAVVREFIHPRLSRSALDRCLRRNGVSRLADLTPTEPSEEVKAKPFKAYEPG